jgi:hypothetical protein
MIRKVGIETRTRRAAPNDSDRGYLEMDVCKSHSRELSYIVSQWCRLFVGNHADHKPLQTNGPTPLLCGGEWKPALREVTGRPPTLLAFLTLAGSLPISDNRHQNQSAAWTLVLDARKDRTRWCTFYILQPYTQGNWKLMLNLIAAWNVLDIIHHPI